MLLRRISVLAVLALSLGSTIAVAQANPHFTQKLAQQTGQERGQRDKAQFLQQLGLNSQQVQQIQGIQAKYRPQIGQYRQSLKQAQEELSNMMAGTASSADIRKKHDEIRGLRQKVEDAQFASILEMREVLSPEQRAKFAQMMQHRRTKFLKHAVDKKGAQS